MASNSQVILEYFATPKHRVLALLALFMLCAVAMFSLNPIAQDLAYHHFADDATLFSIPHFWNVISNLPFSIIGLWGLWLVVKHSHHLLPDERWLWAAFAFGLVLIGLGSGYYHLAPDNHTLVWDRLPMTISFMAFFALMIMDRVDGRHGSVAGICLLVLGAASVFYWGYTESIGQGDLRPYVLVQFFPMIAVVFMLWLFPSRSGWAVKPLYMGLVFYLLAKVLEHFDQEIHILSGQIMGGHPLKHIAAAMGGYFILRYMQKGVKSEHSRAL